MLSNIKNFLRKNSNQFLKFYAKKSINFIKKFDSEKYPIATKFSIGEIIDNVKPTSIEDVTLPPIFDSTFGGLVKISYPKIDIIKYSDAWFFPDSDFIVSHDSIVWHKFHSPHFWRMIPRDPEILGIKKGNAIIKKPKIFKKVKAGFYLCGMSSRIWSHFLLEHLPKLYCLPDILKIETGVITVILPRHIDPHICEIINNYVSRLNQVEVLVLDSNEVAKCEVLYHIENTAFFMDDMIFASPCDDVQIPKFVADSLKNNLINNSTYKNLHSNFSSVKLYLARLGDIRNLINAAEVEQYFVDLGFLVVYPHLLTMQEKFELFNNASIVVGPASSAFANLIFSRPNTKVLCFVNYFRCFDPWCGFLAENFGLKLLMLTGVEAYTTGSVINERNKSYTIPLDKIRSACIDLDIL